MIYLIMLLGFFLRLININQSLWLDEAITALAVKNNSFIELITKFAPGDFHPPLYYLFLKLWSDVFGYSEVALRFPSIIFSLGTGYFIYLIGAKLANKKIGLIASFFWMINPLAIYYAQEARMYSLAAFAISGAVYFFLQKKWLWYFLFFFISIASDYLPILMLPVFLLLSQERKKFIIYHLSFIIPALLWSPLLITQLMHGLTASSSSWATVLGQFDPKALPLTFVKFIIGRISLNNKFLYALLILPISLAYLYTLVRARNKILWPWLALPLILGGAISLFIPIYSYFRFLFVLPAFTLLLAIGSEGKSWLQAFIVVVSLASLLFFDINPEFQREDWRSAVKYIQSDQGLVVFPNAAQSAGVSYYGPEIEYLGKEKASLADTNSVYLMRYVQEIFDPEDYAKKTLESRGFVKTDEKSFNGVVVWKYQK